MKRLEKNQVEMRMDMNNIKGNMYQMLEVMLAQSKNNLQHAITENVGATSSFTMMTNPLYGIHPDYAPL